MKDLAGNLVEEPKRRNNILATIIQLAIACAVILFILNSMYGNQ